MATGGAGDVLTGLITGLLAQGYEPVIAARLGVFIHGLAGALAALAGAFLVFQQHTFTDNMSAGRGYIALAAMIIGKWNPAGAALASLLFATTESMEIWLQTGWIPSQLVQSMPYIITLVVLAGFVGKASAPRDAGIPFEKNRRSE
jgi:simple sugar transport system permease protein